MSRLTPFIASKHPPSSSLSLRKATSQSPSVGVACATATILQYNYASLPFLRHSPIQPSSWSLFLRTMMVRNHPRNQSEEKDPHQVFPWEPIVILLLVALLCQDDLRYHRVDLVHFILPQRSSPNPTIMEHKLSIPPTLSRINNIPLTILM